MKNEENGLIVEIDDVPALTEALNRMIKDTDLQKHVIENGMKAYQEGFTREVFKKNVMELYSHVLR